MHPSTANAGAPKGGLRKFFRDESSSSSNGNNHPQPANRRTSHNIAHLLEPAVDGPPSPERLRALNMQAKQNSSHDGNRLHGLLTTSTASFASSTNTNSTLDKPNSDLSRKSSHRSSTSSKPPRERPESVLVMGKNMLNLRGKLRREGSDPSVSGSSNSESHHDPIASSKELMASVFSKRRTRIDLDPSAIPKKPQISEPYNFQHLTHTNKDSLPNISRASRMELVSEFSGMRAGQRPTRGSLKGIQADDLHFHNFHTGEMTAQQDPSAGLHAGTRSTQMSPVQDELTTDAEEGPTSANRENAFQSPPRKQRSSFEPEFPSPIPPPPRTSSRMSVLTDHIDPNSSRPTTADGPATEGLRPPPPQRSTSEESINSKSKRMSRGAAIAEEDTWPLAHAHMGALPEVPEEEEVSPKSADSRVSVASNHSSLRGSVSVPLLRQMSVSQSSRRSPSNASDTLGKLDPFVIRGAIRVDEPVAQRMPQATWEDDIDYCYNHAAEADCDYAWERPSLEIARARETEESGSADDDTSVANSTGSDGIPDFLSIGSSDSPIKNGAGTPSLNVPVTSNFSLPHRAHNRTLSRTLSFQESQGFTLSPSLLIPNDFHEEMLKHERAGSVDGDTFLTHLPRQESNLKLGTTMLLNARSSASTTDSAYSQESFDSSRHKSYASNSTDFTRWTASSTTPSLEEWQAMNEQAKLAAPVAAQDEDQATVCGPKNDLELPEFGVPASAHKAHAHERTRSDANLLNNSCEVTTKLASKETPTKNRRRARTTSRSHNGPPQLGLFPHVPAHGSRV